MERRGKAMGLTLKRLYVDFLRRRYQATKRRKVKSAIIDQLCRDTGFHRKYALRVLNAPVGSVSMSRGRKKRYSDGAVFHLKRLWKSMGMPAGRRLVAMLPDWLKDYSGNGYGPRVASELAQMSHATIERILKPERARLGRALRTGTKSGRFHHRIPIKAFDRNAAVVGYLEADTVAHCGDTMAGQFLWSLTATDRKSGWTEVRAVWNKHSAQVAEAITELEGAFPFTLKGLSTDNGSEFMNEVVVGALGPRGSRKSEIFLTRGRPYKKNDQSYVEQKNYTLVRKLLGYERLDCPEVTALVNDLYRNEWSHLQNFFMPQTKLIEKIRVGSKYKRRHSKPITSYRRLLESPEISDAVKAKLTERFEGLNPFKLTEAIERKLENSWKTQAAFEARRNLTVATIVHRVPSGNHSYGTGFRRRPRCRSRR
jgi:hypothetical protein